MSENDYQRKNPVGLSGAHISPKHVNWRYRITYKELYNIKYITSIVNFQHQEQLKKDNLCNPN